MKSKTNVHGDVDLAHSAGYAEVKNGCRIAVFDLDGTLTTNDSFVAFLITFGLRHRSLLALAKMPCLIAGYLCGWMRDFQLKQRLLQNFFTDVNPEQVDQHAEWFCHHWLPRHLHPIGYSLLKEHVAAGDRIILLSASPELYVPKIAETLGIQEVICTRVKQEKDRWTGEIDGRNCKGEEKVAAIRRWLAVEQSPEDCYAYGDSKSDLPVLRWVTRGALIRKKRLEPIGDRTLDDFPAFCD